MATNPQNPVNIHASLLEICKDTIELNKLSTKFAKNYGENQKIGNEKGTLPDFSTIYKKLEENAGSLEKVYDSVKNGDIGNEQKYNKILETVKDVLTFIKTFFSQIVKFNFSSPFCEAKAAVSDRVLGRQDTAALLNVISKEVKELENHVSETMNKLGDKLDEKNKNSLTSMSELLKGISKEASSTLKELEKQKEIHNKKASSDTVGTPDPKKVTGPEAAKLSNGHGSEHSK